MTLKQEPETAGALAESTKDGPKDVPERPTYAQVRQFVEDVTFLRGREGRAATAADDDEVADDAEVSPIAVLRASAARLLEDRDQLLEELRKLETSKLRAQKLLASFGRL
ncbi:unnamed protein product [Schistocephalus solidus]|uniref:Smoothelin domain-containing protein n=1 Tax=Schistocephalus solidus TaxID=70667 RepID=A0A0V0JCM2_SCHSO|nr:unnamed protein product [Schistocephalus solidus]